MKVPFGTLLALLGVAALPGASPPVQVARVLLTVAGLGFGLYLLFFVGVFIARLRLRATRSRPGRAL
ncbi:hypothetical protein LO762_29585 [Actinocorallia sp. API 0066]|uniref:hypothetical protein n=1 Tax=Actinocorallia sp. API 0066 TaxID=2896846 RepID=UPI001E58FF75|nr:hypothetical protein [Actinocorallia sp. API 0066]MCD0453303.1 hypothetical protein [Actinocorallia sp. API 0066]